LTANWMFNCKTSYDKVTLELVFEKMKWRAPLAAITKADMKE